MIEFDFDTQSDTVEKIARDLIEETGLDAQFEILSQTIRAAGETLFLGACPDCGAWSVWVQSLRPM